MKTLHTAHIKLQIRWTLYTHTLN